ncbi:MAG: hypothetical protein L0287_01610 [Anaerolineae bacterium]|nr:hypothetical protein [Anaerolineae bacterium]
MQFKSISHKIKAAKTKSSRHRTSLLVLCILIVILLAACGGNSRSSGTGQGAIPGKEEFGMTKDELVTNIEAVEAIISQCMREAGFEYIAADYNTVRRGMVADKSLPEMGERQFIEQYGYGISTLYTGLAPQISDVSTPAKIGLGDQNVRIFQSLSSADQVAYSHTLFGEHPDATFAVALETEDFSRTGGCTRSAIEQVFSAEQFSVTYLNPFDALVEQDPRMIAANAEFADCLRAAGFDYNFERKIEPDLRKRLDTITGGLPFESLSSEARAALIELQGYERALASVAVGCEQRFLDPVANQVERELYAGPQQ